MCLGDSGFCFFLCLIVILIAWALYLCLSDSGFFLSLDECLLVCVFVGYCVCLLYCFIKQDGARRTRSHAWRTKPPEPDLVNHIASEAYTPSPLCIPLSKPVFMALALSLSLPPCLCILSSSLSIPRILAISSVSL